ncbi:hypothetical protein K431DRAFT_283659 [Polychaeton citri CBS 116435]|uniref:CHAT domain-containing protein n=1 Tax=Polychaeton citri CBS 116435 TaxID=1314669 RepID=A0A9P4US91_9PEZI|nr:hypothetical protein K431DRAFT_283659 [Polychaeton citri CBS 116435]
MEDIEEVQVEDGAGKWEDIDYMDDTEYMERLERATNAARNAADAAPHDHPNRPFLLNHLRARIESQYDATGDATHLERAVEAAQNVVDCTPLDHPDRTAFFISLSSCLALRSEEKKDMKDLEQAIEIAQHAVDSAPPDYPRNSIVVAWENLKIFLEMYYKQTEKAEDLERVRLAEEAKQAIKSIPLDSPNLGLQTTDRRDRYMDHHEKISQAEDIDQAIEATQRAVDTTPISCREHAIWLHDLAIKLKGRYEQASHIEDLERAIAACQQAIESMAFGYLGWASALNTLGSLLLKRYEHRGNETDLAQAIELAQQAVDSTPVDDPQWASWSNNLGCMLQFRYGRTGEGNDLERAIKAAWQALEHTRDDDPDQAMRLENLATKLEKRYQRTGNREDLELAISALQHGLDSLTVADPARAGLLSNLGYIMGSRYESTNDLEDIGTAIKAAQQAVDSTLPHHGDRPGFLNNLGVLLQTRFEQTRDAADLEQAIEIAQQAVKSTPANHSDLTPFLSNLGIYFECRYRLNKSKHEDEQVSKQDLAEASRHFLSAFNVGTSEALHRVRAAGLCLDLLALQYRTEEGIELGSKALHLLPLVYTRSLEYNDQTFVVSMFAGLASKLAALLTATGRLEDALESLEQGRAVIVGQMLDDRTDISALSDQHPQLAQRYLHLLDDIHAPLNSATSEKVMAQFEQQRLNSIDSFHSCLSEIRQTSGNERFLLGQTAAEVQQCAADGYIVYVVVTEFRSSAIVVSGREVCEVLLSELTPSDVKKWLDKDWAMRKKDDHWIKNQEFLEYLEWLWNTCVGQILDRIPAPNLSLGEVDLPRVWWIGCDMASSLPFHAAGIHAHRSDINTYRRVLSSYTPSAKALKHARARAIRVRNENQPHKSILITTMPSTPRGPNGEPAPSDLGGARREADAVSVAVQSTMNVASLTGPSKEQVSRALEECSIAHFACHGVSHSGNPSQSGLILQREGSTNVLEQDFLSVQQISQLRLQFGEIAYLSACSTARNDNEAMRDEVIHVVSGFQVAGFPHVIGCLWPAGDSECVDVAKQFYDSILSHGGENAQQRDIALALQNAVLKIREEDMDMPLNWAPFVHFGA